MLTAIDSSTLPPVSSPPEPLADLEKRYQKLLARLPDVGFILKGSVVERRVRCGSPGCRCHADPEQLHGPYWQWSTAVAGKTVSRRLTAEQARRYRTWIDNRKRLEAILSQMHEISAEAAAILAANDESGEFFRG
jgi:hypothetical protein